MLASQRLVLAVIGHRLASALYEHIATIAIHVHASLPRMVPQ